MRKLENQRKISLPFAFIFNSRMADLHTSTYNNNTGREEKVLRKTRAIPSIIVVGGG